MFNTLYKKLALLLFAIIIGIGVLLYLMLGYTSDMYQQEVSQKLNTDIAKHIVAEESLLHAGVINQDALKQVFHMLMVINPSIEVYLLDPDGKILSYSAPDDKIKRQHIDLQPIRQFINDSKKFPLLGDDPRGLQQHKVFSAAPIYHQQELQGYLYIILGGETYDGVADMIRDSYILKVSVFGIGAALLIALISGLLFFALLSRRIKCLSGVMHNFLNGSSSTAPTRYPHTAYHRDEIDQLGERFNIMADRIDQQVNDLKQNDAKRRELVANVSHDLRTPLTSLHGYLETLLLKDKTLSQEERQRYLKIIISQSERLNHLIAELFELAKLDSVETLLSVEPFSLAELVQDVSQKYALIANQQGVTLKTELNRELPFVYGDIALIQRALENLLDNAIRHTNKDGEISLSLTKHQQNITVQVADTGCGIAKEDMDHIFDRFYQAKRQGNENEQRDNQHSGLGLAITKKIVSLHGSEIQANSTPNVGTTFSFDLPAYQAG